MVEERRPQRRVVILAGLPGSGKTTLALRLQTAVWVWINQVSLCRAKLFMSATQLHCQSAQCTCSQMCMQRAFSCGCVLVLCIDIKSMHVSSKQVLHFSRALWETGKPAKRLSQEPWQPGKTLWWTAATLMSSSAGRGLS